MTISSGLKTRNGDALTRLAIDELATLFNGILIEPGTAEYDQARRVWNTMIDRRPGLIAMCLTAHDVIQAVRFARAYDLETTVRSGGHGVAGRAVCDDGIVIDLSQMKSVMVDTRTNIIDVQAGVTLGELDRATASFGLAVPVGVAPPTGIAGLTLGGGVGWLTRKYGMTCDNVVGFEVVTADGFTRIADALNNPDLFWALRGGGGNFGIVTSFRFQAHPVGTVFGGMVLYRRDEARQYLKLYREFMKNAPDELTVYVGLVSAPDGTPVVRAMGCYCGDPSQGENVLRPLRNVGKPVLDTFQPIPFIEMQKLADNQADIPISHYWRSAFLNDLSDEAIDIILDHANKASSPLTGTIIQCFGGAVGRVPETAMAFAQRQPHYNIGIEAAWTDPGDNDRHIRWARDFSRALQPLAGSGYLLNFLNDEGSDAVREAYASNYARLAHLKARYDPTNFFKGNQNIMPMTMGEDLLVK